MNYGQTRVYGVSLSYLTANGNRSFSYYEVPAESENVIKVSFCEV